MGFIYSTWALCSPPMAEDLGFLDETPVRRLEGSTYCTWYPHWLYVWNNISTHITFLIKYNSTVIRLSQPWPSRSVCVQIYWRTPIILFCAPELTFPKYIYGFGIALSSVPSQDHTEESESRYCCVHPFCTIVGWAWKLLELRNMGRYMLFGMFYTDTVRNRDWTNKLFCYASV